MLAFPTIFPVRQSCMQTPWLSLLIPVFNCEPYLDDCVNSWLASADGSIEILFYDDASTDGSSEKLQAIGARAIPGLKVIHGGENRGVSVARNRLLANATGEYVWFLDADDYLFPGALSQLRTVLLEHPEAAVLFDYQIVPESVDASADSPADARRVTVFGGTSNRLSHDKNALFEGMFARRRFHSWGRVYKRELWNAGEPFPEGRYFEDLYSVARTSALVEQYFYLPKALVAYRSRATSIVRSPSRQKVEDLLAAPRGVLEYWAAQGVVLDERSRFAYYSFCVTNFVNAVKLMRKAGINTRDYIAVQRAQLLADLNISTARLIFLHARYGRVAAIYRALRYMYAKR